MKNMGGGSDVYAYGQLTTGDTFQICKNPDSDTMQVALKKADGSWEYRKKSTLSSRCPIRFKKGKFLLSNEGFFGRNTEISKLFLNKTVINISPLKAIFSGVNVDVDSENIRLHTAYTELQRVSTVFCAKSMKTNPITKQFVIDKSIINKQMLLRYALKQSETLILMIDKWNVSNTSMVNTFSGRRPDDVNADKQNIWKQITILQSCVDNCIIADCYDKIKCDDPDVMLQRRMQPYDALFTDICSMDDIENNWIKCKKKKTDEIQKEAQEYLRQDGALNIPADLKHMINCIKDVQTRRSWDEAMSTKELISLFPKQPGSDKEVVATADDSDDGDDWSRKQSRRKPIYNSSSGENQTSPTK